MRAKLRKISHATHRNAIKNMLRKLLTPNIQRIKRIISFCNAIDENRVKPRPYWAEWLSRFSSPHTQ